MCKIIDKNGKGRDERLGAESETPVQGNKDHPKPLRFSLESRLKTSKVFSELNHLIRTGRAGKSIGFGFKDKAHPQNVSHGFF